MMERPSRVELLMEIAGVVARRGTCSRLQVGALAHDSGRILVTGYNGAPAGLPHCDHSCTCAFRGQSHTWQCAVNQPCTVAQHAERNCIDWAARRGTSLQGSELVTTDSPCSQCAGSIINAGITSVIALRPYRSGTGSEMLTAAGVSLVLYEDMIGSSS